MEGSWGKDLLVMVRTVFLVEVDESGFLVGLQGYK